METKEFLAIFEKAEKAGLNETKKQLSFSIPTQAIVVFSFILFFLLLSSYFILSSNVQEPKKTNLQNSTQSVVIKPTPVQSLSEPSVTTLSGTITCLSESVNSIDNFCNIGIKTTDGFYYRIPNISKSEIALGKYTIGRNVVLQGVLKSLRIMQKDSVLTNVNIAGEFYIIPATDSASTNSAAASALVPTATPTPFPSTPFNNTVNYILQNRVALNNQIVNVSAYLVNGNIGQDSCIVIDPCDHWELFLSDNIEGFVNTNSTLTVYINQKEKEEDYTLGKRISVQGKVILSGDTEVLEKTY